ncbi:hypothetical protein [Occultella kanbiaonis]|uniref:hypothetical protein n=1 Tax=Occultella kanbiaonis TaxID=2675754 RepID=UPI0013D461C9|nr:hypothetical protein [Occultella kanbiaonis]
MPDRHRRARHEPPSLLDHVLGHPFEVAVSAWWIVAGVLVTLTVIGSGTPASASLGRLPMLLMLGVGATVGTGGILALAGVIWPGTRLTTAWAVERAGWLLGGAGWTAYLAAVAWAYPRSLVTISLAAVMVTGAALRIVALYQHERQVRADVHETGTDA